MQGDNKTNKEEEDSKDEFYHDQYYALYLINDKGIS
jgi:hypothetical protein